MANEMTREKIVEPKRHWLTRSYDDTMTRRHEHTKTRRYEDTKARTYGYKKQAARST